MESNEFTKTELAEIAQRIKEAVASLGRGGKALIASKTGNSRQAITNWTRKGQITKTNLSKLSKLTGYSIDWILFNRGEKKVIKLDKKGDNILNIDDSIVNHQLKTNMSPRFIQLLLNIENASIAWIIFMLSKLGKTAAEQRPVIESCIKELELILTTLDD